MYAILVLLFAVKIEINASTKKNNSGKQIPEKNCSEKGTSKKPKTLPKETAVQNLTTLKMRIKVGGTKLALGLAGVRLRSSM